MLTVADIFKVLSYGQLSNLSLANSGTGEIKLTEQNKVIVALNEALTRLYSRFALLEKDVVLLQQGHITNYHLDKRYALFNAERTPNHYPYILDLPGEMFDNDAIRILAVHDALGNKLVLNNENVADSVYTPYPTILQVPCPQHDVPLSVQYQAKHPKLQYSVLQGEVIIPAVLEGALLAATAYSVFTNMNTQESTGKAAEHMALYEAICTDVERQGTASTHASSNVNKFDLKGWL